MEEEEEGLSPRPVLVALGPTLLDRRRQHNNSGAELLPDHEPEVGGRVAERALAGDVPVDYSRAGDLHLNSLRRFRPPGSR